MWAWDQPNVVNRTGERGRAYSKGMPHSGFARNPSAAHAADTWLSCDARKNKVLLISI
jgi:hypothetical protein